MTLNLIRTLAAGALALMALAAAPSVAAAQNADLTKRGAQVYEAQKCGVCHAIAGKGGKASPLDGVGAKLSDADLRRWITHPAEMTAKTKSTKKPPMPEKWGKLPAADVDALVAYLQSLK